MRPVLHLALPVCCASLMGCPTDESVRGKSQLIMKQLLKLLTASERGERTLGEKLHIESLLLELMDEMKDTAMIVHDASQAAGYASLQQPLPCVPGIVATEFLQLLYLQETNFEEAREVQMH